MKRGAPLRRTPMKRVATKINPISKTKKRRREQAAAPSMGDLRPLLWKRCAAHCERCGCAITFNTFEAHHRQFRSRGGKDVIENLVALCKGCHVWVHSNDRKAQVTGHVVSAYRLPAYVPVKRAHGLPVFLTPAGTYSRKAPLPTGTKSVPETGMKGHSLIVAIEDEVQGVDFSEMWEEEAR